MRFADGVQQFNIPLWCRVRSLLSLKVKRLFVLRPRRYTPKTEVSFPRFLYVLIAIYSASFLYKNFLLNLTYTVPFFSSGTIK